MPCLAILSGLHVKSKLYNKSPQKKRCEKKMRRINSNIQNNCCLL